MTLAAINDVRQIDRVPDTLVQPENHSGKLTTRKVVPVLRNGRWGWGVEWCFPGEFPVTRGFFAREAAARAAAERGLGFETNRPA